MARTADLGRRLPLGTLLGLAGVAVALALAQLPPWRDLEDRMRSAALAQRPRPWNPRVVVMALDDSTLEAYPFPPSREMTGRLLEAVHAAGARAIGVDMIYQAAHSEDGQRGTERMAQALSAADNIVLATECVNPREDVRARPFATGPRSRLLDPEGQAPARICKKLIGLAPGLAVAGPIGAVQLFASGSQQLVGVRAIVQVDRLRIPNLALQMGSIGEGWAAAQSPTGISLGGGAFELGQEGESWVSARKRPAQSVISVGGLFQALSTTEPPRLPPELAARFADRYVFLAATSVHVKDIGLGPGGEPLPLVYLHANFLQDLLEQRQVRPIGRAADTLVALLLGLLMVLGALKTRPVVATFALATGLLGTLGATLLLAGHGLLASPLGWASAAALGFVGALGGRLTTQDRERALLREAFGAYVDPGVLDRILEHPERYLALGGARRTLSVLFSDIQGYTGLSNQLPPEEVIDLLREYLEAMTTIVRSRKGRIDKIMGDGIMAVFGDPIPDAGHAESAVLAALDMQSEMARLVERWTREGKAKLAIRIGVATGEVFVGNIGSRQAKIEYTVLGPTVNLASRLEGKAPPGGVLVSESTRVACGEAFHYERVENISLKGYAEAQVAYLPRRKPPAEAG